MFHKKAQTATEYMIILAVVIIIALIVVGVLGGIPAIGGGARNRASSAYWETAEIGVVSVAMSTTGTAGNHILRLKNNNKDSITIKNISLSLTASGDYVSYDENITDLVLTPGQIVSVTNSEDFNICTTAGESFASQIYIIYDDDATGSEYMFDGEGNRLEGRCSN